MTSTLDPINICSVNTSLSHNSWRSSDYFSDVLMSPLRVTKLHFHTDVGRLTKGHPELVSVLGITFLFCVLDHAIKLMDSSASNNIWSNISCHIETFK